MNLQPVARISTAISILAYLGRYGIQQSHLARPTSSQRIASHTGAADRTILIFGRNEIHMLNDDRGEAGLAFFELNAELSIDRFGERKGTILECFRRFG